ncbi:hypothetical protein AGMMS49573_09380 [Endomicrobiia bacterium]|nr:hypothetical protein AGMMS49573_09380 [Endomicrobiia bacterium]
MAYLDQLTKTLNDQARAIEEEEKRKKIAEKEAKNAALQAEMYDRNKLKFEDWQNQIAKRDAKVAQQEKTAKNMNMVGMLAKGLAGGYNIYKGAKEQSKYGGSVDWGDLAGQGLVKGLVGGGEQLAKGGGLAEALGGFLGGGAEGAGKSMIDTGGEAHKRKTAEMFAKGDKDYFTDEGDLGNLTKLLHQDKEQKKYDDTLAYRDKSDELKKQRYDQKYNLSLQQYLEKQTSSRQKAEERRAERAEKQRKADERYKEKNSILNQYGKPLIKTGLKFLLMKKVLGR